MVIVPRLMGRVVVVAVGVAILLSAREARVSGSSHAELVRDSFRLTFETPSIAFADEADEARFHGEFRDEAGAGLAWIADRVEAALSAYEMGAIVLGPFDPAHPQVDAWQAPGEQGSLELAPAGPVRYLVMLPIGGEAAFHVPAMTMVSLELTVENRPSREALQALVDAVAAAVAAAEPAPSE